MKNKETTFEKVNRTRKRCAGARKITIAVTAAMVLSAMTVTSVSAAGTGAVSATDFINKACTVLKSVIILIGGGLGVLGIVNLLEAYGGDNASARSQGMKQLMAGLGLILLAIILVPELKTMMTNAV